jgi:hypothetical protein
MTLLHLRVRDLFLRLAAEAYCAGMSNSAAAEWVHRKISRYRACAWQRDRVAETVPPRLTGHVNGLLWCVLKCRHRVPSARLIRLALSRQCGEPHELECGLPQRAGCRHPPSWRSWRERST